jgi:hypothetical protein
MMDHRIAIYITDAFPPWPRDGALTSVNITSWLLTAVSSLPIGTGIKLRHTFLLGSREWRVDSRLRNRPHRRELPPCIGPHIPSYCYSVVGPTRRWSKLSSLSRVTRSTTRLTAPTKLQTSTLCQVHPPMGLHNPFNPFSLTSPNTYFLTPSSELVNILNNVYDLPPPWRQRVPTLGNHVGEW